MPDLDLDALCDLQTPWCVHVVATLGIAEQLRGGTHDIGELARACGCDAGALHNTLGHLVAKGVFAEPRPGWFELNEAAEQLFVAQRFLDLRGIGGRLAGAWSTLPAYVRTGRTAYHEVFGMGFWEDLAAHPELGASFDELMGIAGHGEPEPHFELRDGWTPVRRIVDIGGGSGAMLAAVLRARPALHGTLVDLPGTVARSARTFEAAGVVDRVDVVGQSFFDGLPPGADVYLLRKVLNDWPAQETAAILRRCSDAASAHDASVVVMGGVSPDDAPRRLAIDMLVAGGQTDSLSQFTAMARAAGLEIVAAAPQPAHGYVVECRPR